MITGSTQAGMLGRKWRGRSESSYEAADPLGFESGQPAIERGSGAAHLPSRGLHARLAGQPYRSHWESHLERYPGSPPTASQGAALPQLPQGHRPFAVQSVTFLRAS